MGRNNPNSSSDNILVELKGVGKFFGKGQRQIRAVENISFEIREGEFVALLGPSGCGKSTLLRMITGLVPPSVGEILYRGIPLRGVNEHATIVFQTFALFPWLTVQANVEVALKARGLSPEARRERALKLIDLVGLDGFESAYPRELSGGMRQKVGFARALAVEPELLCLDEPFSALDVLSAEALRGELMELWLSRALPTRAILLVTHNIEEAVLMADRIIVMDKDPGRIVTQLNVTLPQPRHRKDLHFLAMVDRVYASVAGETPREPSALMGTAPDEPGKTEMLPHAPINAIAGLVEYLAEEGKRADLYFVGEKLGMELDEFLPAVEAAELLGMATLQGGDIELTPLGETFAATTILARKEIFAQRIRSLPMFGWIVEELQNSSPHRLPEEFFLQVLERDFTREEAKRQLDIAINWGRYAELFEFDDDRDELYLPTNGLTQAAVSSPMAKDVP
jgi:NitT/TauT family transport system ATP-binding protein